MPRSHFANETVLFAVKALACPQLLNRILGLVAQRNLIPEKVAAIRDGRHLAVNIQLGDIDRNSAGVMAEKMRSIVSVRAVKLSFPPSYGRRQEWG